MSRQSDPDTDILQHLSEINAYLNSSQFIEAKEKIESILPLFPGDQSLHEQACNVFAACNEIEAALELAQGLRIQHPDFAFGYKSAAHYLRLLSRCAEAVDIIVAGLEKFPTEQALLYEGLLAFASVGNHSGACDVGASLVRLYPNFQEGYATYINSLYLSGQDKEAETVINQAYALFPDNLDFIRLRLDLLFRNREYESYRRWLYLLPSQHPSFVSEALLRLHRFEHTVAHRHSVQRNQFDCDVCCIASDEAEYIAEYVHHYLYLGFSNIFIGVNNTSDATREILSKICSVYRNVHVLDLDQTMSQFAQIGCYRELFDYGRKRSLSKYVLFVDVDEFWVADTFPRSVNSFIADNDPFDVYSFHWMCCIGEAQFSPPLTIAESYSWDNHLKSMYSYEAEVYDLRCHSPLMIPSPGISLKMGVGFNTEVSLQLNGAGCIDVHELADDYAASPMGVPGMAWIIHRIFRSELEYASRLFKPRADTYLEGTYFKSNRWGYPTPNPDEISLGYLRELLPESEVHEYHKSLQSFIIDLEIEPMIIAARARASEDAIQEMLKNVPAEVLRSDAQLMLSIFSGTRFHDWVVQATNAASNS